VLLIALMMEAASTSETLVNFYQTAQRKIPEEGHLHTRRRENLKSHTLFTFQQTFIPEVLDSNLDRVSDYRN
jgi:hypothetical protein